RLINTDMRDGFGAMVSVSLPFAYLSKYDAGVDQAKARLTAAHADQRGLQDRIRREVSQALLRVQTARLQRDLFVDTHLPQSEQALRVTESAYQAGVVDFLALTQAARRIEEIHVEHLDAETDLAKAYADLERAVGVVSLQEQPR
ncbi:MAG TPA: TolC family protein, partial [Terriglobales bacterium]|nr:TolC family protein [Terriglobales bacterium]